MPYGAWSRTWQCRLCLSPKTWLCKPHLPGLVPLLITLHLCYSHQQWHVSKHVLCTIYIKLTLQNKFTKH